MSDDSQLVFAATTESFEASVVARSHEVPVLVDFWAPWCGPCRVLTPILEKCVAAQDGKVLLAKVNTDEQAQLAQLFGIRSLPTVMLLKDGRPLDGFMGVQPESVIREILEAHVGPPAAVAEAEPEVVPVDPAQRALELRAAIAAEPGRDESKLELATVLMSLGEVDEAARLLDALPANLAESAPAQP